VPEETKNPEGKGSGSHPHDAGDYDNKAPNPSDLEFFNDPTVRGHQEYGSTSPGNRRPDKEIKSEIERLLAWQKTIDATAIQVDVKDGVVSLSGNVGSPNEKQVAENITGNVLGIREINNLLNVNRQDEEEQK
jgi:hypothetical protein